MPPPESLVSPGGAAQRKERTFAFLWGVFGRQPAAVWGCRLVRQAVSLQKVLVTEVREPDSIITYRNL
ncbi:MAG: hypothetical protein U9Q68_06300 [Euryarchaeota archaeon]|nr:hypothetical protein [Euryarchaeota archaeon]